jgi:hypothetical protein
MEIPAKEDNLRTSTLVLLSAVLLFFALPQQGGPQNRANFWFLNNTGKTVQNFYVSPHSSQAWGADVLGRATLPSAVGVVIMFPENVHHVCNEDFKLVFSDGTSQVYQQGMNVCQLHAVQFNADTADGY